MMPKIKFRIFFVLLFALLFTIGVVVLNVGGLDGPCSYRTQEQVAWAITNKGLRIPLLKYKGDEGRYPMGEEGLDVLHSEEKYLGNEYRGPYLSEVPLDPWKNP
jgi:hypothetical protein